MYLNLINVRSKHIYHVNVYNNQVFLNRNWEIVQKLFILKLESDLDPKH